MNIEIRDAALQARIQKQLQATGSGSVEEVLLRLLDSQEERIAGFRRTGRRSTRRSGAAWMNSTAAKESPKTDLMLIWLT